MKYLVLVAFGAAASVLGLSGQATTTRYYDGSEGACGCGTSSGLYSWQTKISSGVYTAAGSQALFAPDSSTASWCGSGCGTCYNLTSTGVAPSGQGTGGAAGESIVVLVTNLCPYSGNAAWCPQSGSQNAYGYAYHFDIMAGSSALGQVLGDNPVVNFAQVSCPAQATADWEECVCYGE